jgi:hypothetical protein
MVTSSQYLKDAEYIRIEQIRPTSLLKFNYKNDDIEPNAPIGYLGPRKKSTRRGRIVRKIISSVKRDSAIGRSLVKEYWLKDRTLVKGKMKYPGNTG